MHASSWASQDAPGNRTLLRAALIWAGQFRAPPTHTRWCRENVMPHAAVVFPRTAVEIQHRDRPTVIATPNVVMLYNDEQPYRAELLSPEGDRCEWLHVRRDVLFDAVRRFDPTVEERPDAPFPFSWGPCDGQTYLRQRRIFHACMERTHRSALELEEQFLRLVDAVVTETFTMHGFRPSADDFNRQHRHLANEVIRQLVRAPSGPHSLEGLASAVGVSVYHLCRLFRRQTGCSIHRYWTDLRLRLSLERLVDRSTSIATVALLSGFSSQSHYTDAFRARFRTTPAAWRRSLC